MPLNSREIDSEGLTLFKEQAEHFKKIITDILQEYYEYFISTDENDKLFPALREDLENKAREIEEKSKRLREARDRAHEQELLVKKLQQELEDNSKKLEESRKKNKEQEAQIGELKRSLHYAVDKPLPPLPRKTKQNKFRQLGTEIKTGFQKLKSKPISMRELDFVVLDLDSESKETCDFCSKFYGEDNKSVRQIISRVKDSGEYVSDDVVCEECEAKYWNDQIPKCERCGRLQTKLDVDLFCRCIRRKENLEEKQLPRLPHQRERFYERQKQEVLDKIKQQEAEIERLKKLTPQKLINEIESYKEEVARLKSQLEKLNSQQSAQIEVKGNYPLTHKIDDSETQKVKMDIKVEVELMHEIQKS
ncbi:hypothetical protein G9A89_019163 [Geosiphon pyriformis]|nr:hypothetical protein G9A89_019163 [Geosiphon pyriformis]